MARPVTIRNETIVEAARQVFLERGIQATTAEVAARAGVSEGSIFKRFKTKVELFRAAMGAELDGPMWLDTLDERVGRGEIEASLNELGLEIIAFFRRILPIIMMAWSNPAPDGLPFLLSGPNPPPLGAVKRLAEFFEREVKLGRIGAIDPEVAGRMFIGSINHYVFTEMLYRNSPEIAPPMSPEAYVEGLVAIFLAGARGSSAAAWIPPAALSASASPAPPMPR